MKKDSFIINYASSMATKQEYNVNDIKIDAKTNGMRIIYHKDKFIGAIDSNTASDDILMFLATEIALRSAMLENAIKLLKESESDCRSTGLQKDISNFFETIKS